VADDRVWRRHAHERWRSVAGSDRRTSGLDAIAVTIQTGFAGHVVPPGIAATIDRSRAHPDYSPCSRDRLCPAQPDAEGRRPRSDMCDADHRASLSTRSEWEVGHMDSIERVAAAIGMRTPDRVPVDLHNFLPAARALGQPFSRTFRDGELLAEAMLDAWREFGHDMILLENGTGCNAEACGASVTYRDDSAPVADEPILASLDDVDQLVVPDPETTFPMSEVLKATRILAKEIGDRAWIVARADQGPFDLASQLFGIENLMMAIAEGESDGVNRLLDYTRSVATRYAFALLDAGGRSTSIGEPVSGPGLISPADYRTFAMLQQRRIARDIRARGGILANHICGDTIPIFEDYLSTEAQILEIDHVTDPRRAKDLARGKACLLGTLDTNVLTLGTPGEVEDAVHEAIAILAPDSGFILGPGCALGPETPSDNIHAFVEAAHTYGVYPT
jgi:MtaA/CmuA family methyltransferase